MGLRGRGVPKQFHAAAEEANQRAVLDLPPRDQALSEVRRARRLLSSLSLEPLRGEGSRGPLRLVGLAACDDVLPERLPGLQRP